MKKLLLSALALAAVAPLTGCRGQTSHETPLFGIRNMYDQTKYVMQSESDFFPDHRTMRPLPEGVIAHDQEVNPEIATGRTEADDGYVMTIPPTVVQRMGGPEALVDRGKARFTIYCVPCHDATGSGEGLVKRRAVAGGAAAFAPPTFHQDRIRHLPDGQIFATISHGKGNMPPYAMQIPVDDRWAIISYVRSLEISQPKMTAPAASPTTIPTATSLPAPGGSVAPMPGGALAPPPNPTAAVPAPPGDSKTTAASGAKTEKPPPGGKPTGSPNATPPVQEKKP